MATLYDNSEDQKEISDKNENRRDFSERNLKPEVISNEEDFDEKSVDQKYTPYIINFLEKHKNNLSVSVDTSNTFKVSQVLGGLARLYEKIRSTVEYKGEHVIRRNAIERIVKRLVWSKDRLQSNIDEGKIAESLVKELIWGGYLKNNSVPLRKVKKIEKSVTKYIRFIKNFDNFPEGVNSSKVRNWIWGVASSEIEEILDPQNREIYVKLMQEWFFSHFNWIDEDIDDHNKNIQVYLAVHRAFTKSDDPIMRYHLLLHEYPDWNDADEMEVNKMILEFPKIYAEIEDHLSFPQRFTLYRLVQKHAAAFDIFHEIALEQKGSLSKLIEKKGSFDAEITSICNAKYKVFSKKISTGIIRSVIYIFITKVILAMLIEIPYEVYFHSEVRYIPLSINIIFPPIMMWAIGMSIKVPGAKNTEAIISRLHSVVYRSGDKDIQNFSVKKSKKNTTAASIFGIFYALLFILVFGGISYLLTMVNYSIFGMIIFFMFISLVMLFAYRIRFNSNQIRVDSEKEGIFAHIMSYITLPFLNFGFYLSRGLAKINIFTIFLDFIIETPLKSIIEIFEEWTSFIREKKEEVVELPDQ